MDRFPSEFYEIFKQQLVARGINASEISTCEEQIFEGKFTDLIDAIHSISNTRSEFAWWCK